MNKETKHHHVVSKNVEEEEDEACAYALHVSLSHAFPVVLNAAVQLELFDIIARAGPGAQISPSEIVSKLSAVRDPKKSAPMIDSMLQLLASNSLLTCSVREENDVSGRIYGLTRAGKYFAHSSGGSGGDDGGSTSLAPFVHLAHHRAPKEAWFCLKDAVIEGDIAFKKAHGMHPFHYMGKDPTFYEVFHKAMAHRSTLFMNKILRSYKGFDGLGSLVDVGGGVGKTLSMILPIYPSIKGINFDLPHVIESAPSYPGIEHVGGDMFSSIPKGDAVMMKSVLHDWGDEHCMKILKNCHDAVPKNGKVIIIEVVKPELPNTSMAAKYAAEEDNEMLLYTGGKERTEKEFQALCKGSGFLDYQIVCSAYSLCVVEFYK